MRLSYTVRQLARKRGTSGRKFSLALTDQYDTHHREWKFTASRLRRLADALQDAIDGHYGYTHEWEVRESRTHHRSLVVESDRLHISAQMRNIKFLLRTIDHLLEDD